MSAAQGEKGHRWFAALYDWIVASDERRHGKELRSRLMGEAHGRVLEIGVGSGLSFSYYPTDAQVVASEPDPYMLRRARRRLEKLGLSNIKLHQVPVEELPFDDHSFDHVVSSWVLCTVRDLPRALAEARRVLKPEGTFRFSEHVRNEESRFWASAQDVIAPVWRWGGAGCRVNQRTQQAIEEAGFRIEWLQRVRAGGLQPLICGIARPS